MSNDFTPIPYQPPRISLESARLLNTVSALSGPMAVQLGEKRTRFILLPADPSFEPFARAGLKAGAESWTAELSSASVLSFHPALDEAPDIPPGQLPAEIQKAVLSSLMLPLLDRLSGIAGIPLSLEGISLRPDEAQFSGNALVFKILPDEPSDVPPVFLRLVPENGSSLTSDALSFLPRRSDGPFRSVFPLIPVEIAFELGSALLTRQELVSLEADDILFPSSLGQEGSRIFLRSVRSTACPLYAECELRDGNAVLMSKISTVPEPAMEAEELNDLSIKLSFDLGQQTKTLGELSSLDTGYVFLLGMDSETPVNIRAEGRLIAQGRLVDVNGSLGVQVMQILNMQDQPNA